MQQSPHVSLPLSSLLSCVLPAAVVDLLCPLPAPHPSLFAHVPSPLSPESAASFLPSTLSLIDAVRSSRYHDAAFFIHHGADVTQAATDEADEADSSELVHGLTLTLTDEVMRVALREGTSATGGCSSAMSGNSTWPAVLLLLVQSGAPSELSESLTANMCGLPASRDGQLRWAICKARFLAIMQVALAHSQQRHKEQLRAAAVTKAALLSAHQRRQDQLVDALTRLQLEEEKEGRERNRQTATKVRYQMMAARLTERERRRRRRREEQLQLREAEVRAVYEEREKKVRSLLLEVERVRAEDELLVDEVERRRRHLHDTTRSFDVWLQQRQADRAELLRLESETAAMDEELQTVRRQRDEIRQLRSADGQVRLQRQRVTVECGASDVQYVMERRRNQRSHLFFRFYRAVRASSQSAASSDSAEQFESEPCVESAVFPASASSQPPSASSLHNPSWPPLSVDVFSLCWGDESALFRVLLWDSESASSTARSLTGSVRSAAVTSTGQPLLSPSSRRYVSSSSSVVLVGVCEVSLGQLRRSGGGHVNVMMRANEAPDAARAGIFRFVSVSCRTTAT